MRKLLTMVIIVAASAVCYAAPAESPVAFNSRTIRAHAERYGFIPSDSQVAALKRAENEPEKVLKMLTGYVQASYDVCVDALKKGASHPRLKGLDPALQAEVLRKCERDAKNWSPLLKELKAIEVTQGAGFHTVKGKSGKCPHEADGSLNVEKFKAMK